MSSDLVTPVLSIPSFSSTPKHNLDEANAEMQDNESEDEEEEENKPLNRE